GLRVVLDGLLVVRDRLFALPATLMNHGAVVVRLDVQRLELDRDGELLERGAVVPERAERSRVARAEGAVLRRLGDQLRVLPRRLVVASLFEGDAGEVAVSGRRLRPDVPEALEFLDDLRVHTRVAGAGGSGGLRGGGR